MTRDELRQEAARDYTIRLVLETEGMRGAAERGWLGEAEREREIERQRADAHRDEESP